MVCEQKRHAALAIIDKFAIKDNFLGVPAVWIMGVIRS
jgi:hypothetical protein